MNRKSFLQLTALALALLPGTLLADDQGAVYALDNSASGNNVLAFRRAPDGSLTSAGVFSTGGTGTGSGLGNQGALLLTHDGRWLFSLAMRAATRFPSLR